MTNPGDDADLPRPLLRAIQAMEIDAVRLVPLPNPQPFLPEVRTFLVTTGTGERLKARLTRDARRAARTVNLTKLLADPRVPEPVARDGRVTFERWVDGATLSSRGWSMDDIDRSADLLGTIHRFTGGEHERLPQLRRPGAFAEASLARLAGPVQAGRIDPITARRIKRVLVEALPERAQWGFTHGDFAPVNLVAAIDGRLISVDNEHLHRGFLDFDLGFAWSRWPLQAHEQQRFDAAYLAASGRPVLPATRAWRLLAAVRRAGFLHSLGTATAWEWQRLEQAVLEL